LVLVNYGGVQGQDVYQLSEDIKKSVLDKFGVQLQTEVNII
jgi:UDP-N-acetylmuramate dehydrogenase